MSRSPRTLCLAALWSAALWPLALLLLGAADPVAGVRAVLFATWAAGWSLWGAAVLAGAAALLYPPFVPGLRLRLRRTWQRLATADKPVRDAIARLAQFETVNDHFAVGRFLRERGQAVEAAHHLRRAVELDAAYINARYQLALALRDAADAEPAMAELQRICQADPGFAAGQPFLDLAELLAQARRHAEVDELLTRYRRQHGDTRQSLLLHARALASLGRRDEGAALLRLAAQAPAAGVRVPPEEAHARARARVALWFGGFR